MNTQLLNLLLLLVFAHLSSLLLPVYAKVFLSIDCGSLSLIPRTDNHSIVWVGDGPYIQTGESHKVNVPADIPGFDSNVLNTLRAFPSRKKNCYSIDIDNKAENNTRFLVRASFYYGNYDNKSSPPTFYLQFNGNTWSEVATHMDFVDVNEVVFSLKKGNNINVCLAQSQPDNIPFMSSLEVRSLDSDAYNYISSDYPLYFPLRVAYGTNKTIRYPDDSFDRIWVSVGPLNSTSPTMRVRSSSPSINVNIEDKPPEAIFKTALTKSNSSEDLAYRSKSNLEVPFHFNAYFSEVIKLNSTQKRSFDIIVNNERDNSIILPKNPVIPPYGRALEVHIHNVTTFNSSFSIDFRRTDDSTLPSLINALEWFIVGHKLVQGTNSDDVKALGLLQKSFVQLQDSNGDPCLPSPYTWEWVECNSDPDSPRIIALNLNDFGLTGILPDFSAMDALININLSNNNLTQEIPEFLGTFPELTELNLADNNFFGTVPSSISNNVNLMFTATGNPDLLCTPTSICNTVTEPRIIPSPVDKGRSSKTFAQPIIILLIMFSGLLL
ncbi:hypothetical protein MKW98_029998 [Papaver atlanticum]|uniref:Malectin-like domain-containing protein n=1 Tax=Papaver atlanticum TaxID=357466 RepID=A0AAD4T521_9MAGN|nr:hypothetical protein MKW98_029998 [Papaver atlanticum]